MGASCSSVADDASRASASECITNYVFTGAYYAYYDGTYDSAYDYAYYDGTNDSAYYSGDAYYDGTDYAYGDAYYDGTDYAYSYWYCDYSHYRWPNYSYGCPRVVYRGHPTAHCGPHHPAAAA